MVYLNVQCCKYIWMVCSTYIFVRHKLKKNCLRILAYLSFSLLLLFRLDWNHLDIVVGIYPLHTITHTPSTPNHSRMAFTSAPRRALPLVEKAVWQHLNWHYVPLTLSTVTYRSSWKRLTWPQYPGVTMTKCRVLTRHILIGFSYKTLWLTLLIKSYQCISSALLYGDNQTGSLCHSLYLPLKLVVLSPHDPPELL